jgi:hypothetical protein
MSISIDLSGGVAVVTGGGIGIGKQRSTVVGFAMV